MELNKLLDQANEHVVKTNVLMKDVECFETILNHAKEGRVCVHNQGIGSTYLDTVLNEKVMGVLKEIVINTLTEGRDTKIAELQQLIGKVPEQRKPATINKEFENAVAEMVAEHGKDKIEAAVTLVEEPKQELTVELVKNLYHDQNMTLDGVAAELKVTRTTLYNFITKNNLRKPSKREQELFRDNKVQQSKKKPR